MRHKLLLIALLSLMLGASASAQRQKETINFLAEFEWNFVGDYNYQYIRQENGQNLLDGPFTMTATINERGLPYRYYHTADITGNYNLTGNHSNGALHGALTMNASINVKVTNGERQNNTYSFKGNFKNGYPDGNFTVNYPSYGIKANVNYKNGILVGAYSVTGIDSDGFHFTTTGTLTSDGKMTGTWKFDTAYGSSQMSLSNGVVTNQPDYDSDLSVKAKKFAAGTITEEQLLQQNIRLRYENVEIGNDARRLILRSGIDYDKLGWWSFEKSTEVNYCYLDRMATFTDEGFELLKKIIVDPQKIEDNLAEAYYYDEEVYASLQEYNFHDEFYGGRIMYDKTSGLYYCLITSRMPLAEYCVGYPDWSDYREEIFFTKEQFAELQKILHEARMSRIDSASLKGNSYHRIDVSGFTPCYYDKNVLTYKMYNKDIQYCTFDTYEDYYINLGQGSEVLKYSVEERKPVVVEKIKKYEEKVAKEFLDVANQYLNNYILNKKGSSLPYYAEKCSEEYFPIVSFKADGNVYYDASERRYVAPYIVDVPAKLNTDLYTALGVNPHETYNKGGLKTYRVLIKLRGGTSGDSKSVEEYDTFKDSNFVKVENDYDTLANVEAELLKNHKEIVAKYAATLSGVGENPYVKYIAGLTWVLDHSSVETTIAARKEVISIQVDFLKYIELRTEIENNHAKLKAQKSSNKNAYKTYQTYYKGCDLLWAPHKDMTVLEDVISTQEKCFESYESGTDVK